MPAAQPAAGSAPARCGWPRCAVQRRPRGGCGVRRLRRGSGRLVCGRRRRCGAVRVDRAHAELVAACVLGPELADQQRHALKLVALLGRFCSACAACTARSAVLTRGSPSARRAAACAAQVGALRGCGAARHPRHCGPAPGLCVRFRLRCGARRRPCACRTCPRSRGGHSRPPRCR